MSKDIPQGTISNVFKCFIIFGFENLSDHSACLKHKGGIAFRSDKKCLNQSRLHKHRIKIRKIE